MDCRNTGPSSLLKGTLDMAENRWQKIENCLGSAGTAEVFQMAENALGSDGHDEA